jgi:predicted dehydrogenase
MQQNQSEIMEKHQPLGKRRILVIGLDGLRQWSKKSYLEVVGVVDLYCQREELPVEDAQWLKQYQVFPDVAAALTNDPPELAAVIVPGNAKNTFHAEREVLEKGIDLVVLKLRLNSLEDVEELVRIAKISGACLYVGEFYRYLAGVRTVKLLLQENKIGLVEYVVWSCNLPLSEDLRNLWMASYRHLTLEDLAYHHFGALHYLLGFKPTQLYAQSYEPSWTKAKSRSVVSLQAFTMQGYQLHYLTNWGSRTEPTDFLGQIRLEGADGTIELNGNQLTVFSSDGLKQEIMVLPQVYDGFWGIFDHLQDRWTGQSNPLDGEPFTLEQFEPVLRAMYGGVQSAESGNPINMTK